MDSTKHVEFARRAEFTRIPRGPASLNPIDLMDRTDQHRESRGVCRMHSSLSLVNDEVHVLWRHAKDPGDHTEHVSFLRAYDTVGERDVGKELQPLSGFL